MIHSPAKEEDRKIRVALMEDMKMFIRIGNSEAATEAGKASKHLAERIKSHDYSREDNYLKWEKKAMMGTIELLPQKDDRVEV